MTSQERAVVGVSNLGELHRVGFVANGKEN